jgi:2-(3-amino-3-carboxypropyl)histidine synthase
MEATMIANPSFTFYQYDPYTRNLTEEKYANNLMIQRRTEELLRAKNGEHNSLCFILGTLGRQGNPAILQRLIVKVKGKFDYMILLASEINVELLTSVDVDFFVQIACPRLSIDWSYGTPKPLLTPFELFALIDEIDLKKQYSMDYYSHNGGPWSNFYGKAPIKKCI